jgi:hypothetical protein
LFLNGDFSFGSILKSRLNEIKSIGDVIIMHFYQGLYSMEFNVSGVAFKILTETDIALFGLVVVLFGGLKVTVCEVTLGSFEEEKACVAVVLGAFSAAFLIELSEVFEEVRIFQAFILLVVFLDKLMG